MTHSYSAADIDRIGSGVFHRTLPKPEWTHAAHFAAAFWLIERSGRNAAREMPAIIRAYNEATGVANSGWRGRGIAAGIYRAADGAVFGEAVAGISAAISTGVVASGGANAGTDLGNGGEAAAVGGVDATGAGA